MIGVKSANDTRIMEADMSIEDVSVRTERLIEQFLCHIFVLQRQAVQVREPRVQLFLALLDEFAVKSTSEWVRTKLDKLKTRLHRQLNRFYVIGWNSAAVSRILHETELNVHHFSLTYHFCSTVTCSADVSVRTTMAVFSVEPTNSFK